MSRLLLLLLTGCAVSAAEDQPVGTCLGHPCVVPPAPIADPSRGLTPYVVPVPTYVEDLPVPADNPLTHAGVDLGRRLFYDPLLSGNGTQSCASCHRQDLAFTDGKAVSVGAEGRALDRNSMSLVNLAWSAPYFWDGRAPTLEILALQPIAHPDELNQDLDALIEELRAHPDYPARFAAAFPAQGLAQETVARALAQFLRTLVSFNSRADLLDEGGTELTPLELRGNALMVDGLPKGAPDRVQDICDACHKHSAGVKNAASEMGLFTTAELKNNGLEADGRFKVPTIRNVALTAPYMHDGRLADLDAVLVHYNEQMVGGPELEEPLGRGGQPKRMDMAAEDRAAVAAMLGVFTDPVFLVNPAYSDPFAP